MKVGDIVYYKYVVEDRKDNYVVLDMTDDEINKFRKINVIDIYNFSAYMGSTTTNEMSPPTHIDYATNYIINKKLMREIKIKRLLDVRNR